MAARPRASSAASTAASRWRSTDGHDRRASAATRPARARTATPARRPSGSTTTRTRRDRLTAPLRRRPDGTFEEIDWDTAIREVAARLGASATSTAASRSSITAAAARATTSAAPTARATRAAFGVALHLERARPGEDGRVLGRRPAVRSPALPHHAATSSTPRSRCSSARTPGSRTASRAPAIVLKEIAKDPAGALIVIDPAPHRDGRAGRLPPPGPARAWTRSAWRALLGVLVQEELLDDEFLAEHARDGEALFSELERDAGRRLLPRAPAWRRTSCARSHGGWRGASSVSILEDLGIQQAPHSTLNSYLEKLLFLLTGNFGKPGGDEPAHRHRQARRRLRGATPQTPVSGERIIIGLVPGQRDRRRDPHRPPESAAGR